MLNVIDNISLMVIDEDVENIGREINDLRNGSVQKLCLQRLFTEAAHGIKTINIKEIVSRDEIEPLQSKERF